jgi:hypothetical protein
MMFPGTVKERETMTHSSIVVLKAAILLGVFVLLNKFRGVYTPSHQKCDALYSKPIMSENLKKNQVDASALKRHA